MSWYLHKPIAHRGLHDHAAGVPENSLAAISRAVEMGYPVELDVRALRDGTVVAFHDEDMQRLTGEAGPIAGTDARAARGLRLLNTDQPVPFLRDVLEFVDGAVPLLVEVKNETLSTGTLESGVAQLLSDYGGEFAVQSFNPNSLAWFKNHAPEFHRGQLSGAFSDSPIPESVKKKLQYLELNHISAPHFIGYEMACLPFDRVDELRVQGLPVLAWTVRNSEEHARVRPLCDNIVFENFLPDVH